MSKDSGQEEGKPDTVNMSVAEEAEAAAEEAETAAEDVEVAAEEAETAAEDAEVAAEDAEVAAEDAEVATDTVEVKAVKVNGFEAGAMLEVGEEGEAEEGEAEILFEDGDDVADADILFMDPDMTVADTALSDAQAQIESLEEALAAKESEFKTLNNRMLRMAADYDNFRKRSQREKEDLRRFSTEGVLKDLLPIIDNLELAMRHASEEAKGGLAQGVGMVLRQFQQQLGKYGVVGFESMHMPFNPELHEAVQQRPNDEHPHETVIEVYQRGYHIHERLLRPAMVVVADNPDYTEPVTAGAAEDVVDDEAVAESDVDEAVTESDVDEAVVDEEASAEGEVAQAEQETSES